MLKEGRCFIINGVSCVYAYVFVCEQICKQKEVE